MASERNRNIHPLHDECKRLLNYHVILTMRDGSTFDGIIESVDMDRVIVWVGEDVMDNQCENQCNQQRQFGGQRRFRRFRRRAFPLTTLLGLSLLAYPFIAPPFPF